jgi:3-deoxy-manno-octulosonate cytidylyltransferase (CMP-KDO synthetase)
MHLLARSRPAAASVLHCAVPPDRPTDTGLAEHTRTVVIVPARYHSTRLPGKPLLDIAGLPMVVRVAQRAASAAGVTRVLVATDDTRIADAVAAHGGTAVMTRADHPSGTDRLAEVAASLECDLVVNVQGDEPLIAPAMIEQAVSACTADPALPMASLRRRIDDPAEIHDPNLVKVVVDRDGNALYFSRAPIPFARNAANHFAAGLAFKHVGLYVYRRNVLLRLATLPPTALERAEALEQLRALEHGIRIRVVETAWDSVGVDTPEDLERVRRLVAGGSPAAGRWPARQT